MRIIAKNHDYYDPVMKSGFDPSLVYLRNQSEVLFTDYERTKLLPSFWQPYSRWSHRRISVDFSFIGFCGKIYPYLEVSANFPGVRQLDAECYSIQDVDGWVENSFTPKTAALYYKKELDRPEARKWDVEHLRHRFVEFFDKCKELKVSNFPVTDTLPIFVAEPSENPKGFKIALNRTLKEYKFYRVFDAQRAYQELSMFLGSQAVPSKKMPVFSDDDKIQILGHNKVTSFRNMPRDKK